jgi:hypothetical protein
MPGADQVDVDRARARRGLVGAMARAVARTDPALRVGKVRITGSVLTGSALAYGTASIDIPHQPMTKSDLFDWTIDALSLLGIGDAPAAPASVPVP